MYSRGKLKLRQVKEEGVQQGQFLAMVNPVGRAQGETFVDKHKLAICVNLLDLYTNHGDCVY